MKNTKVLFTSLVFAIGTICLVSDVALSGESAAKMCAFSGIQKVMEMLPGASIARVSYADNPIPQSIGGNSYDGEVHIEVANLKGVFVYSCITLDQSDSAVYKTYISIKE